MENKIRPFPGEVERQNGYNGKILLTKEQEDWIREYSPTTPKKILSKITGLSMSWLYQFIYRNRIENCKKRGKGWLWTKKLHGEEFMKEMGKRKSETMRKTYKLERLRVLYGMKKKTNLYIIQKPFTCRQYRLRVWASKAKYFYHPFADDTTGLRWNIYYDKDTERSKELEDKLKKGGFQIIAKEKDKDENNGERRYF